MSTEFSVNMTVKDMYKFLLRHAYYCVSGVISVLISIASIVIMVVRFEYLTPSQLGLLAIAGCMFTVVLPMHLWTRATTIVKLTPSFQKTLNYRVDDEGVYVSQEEEGVLLPWSGVYKSVETRSHIVIYSSPKNGFIFPKNQINESADIVRQLIDKYKDVPFEAYNPQNVDLNDEVSKDEPTVSDNINDEEK
ncbi:MAG: YcxB family protein [Lachnospiraceae bacterium]|nr:YcxB family protein [Lachnospiraceae bacterium]